MILLYITKIQTALQRALQPSEIIKATEFLASGYSVNYAIEYFR